MELARRAKVWDLWFERLGCKIFSRAFYPMKYWVFLQSFWRRFDTKIEIGLFQQNHDNLDLCLEPSSQALFLQLLPLGYGRVMGWYYCYYYHQDLPLVSACHYCKFDVCFEILIFTQTVKRGGRGGGIRPYKPCVQSTLGLTGPWFGNASNQQNKHWLFKYIYNSCNNKTV